MLFNFPEAFPRACGVFFSVQFNELVLVVEL
jgi:hypothetical protein